ncbi:hypothetical protein ACH518_04740 [Methylomonas sp. HW2-6]|uniref:hypothetical protein n=1 Tax=Methylomonas sp. HW2-6 TaxID=3376687 RepID=UPI0040439404
MSSSISKHIVLPADDCTSITRTPQQKDDSVLLDVIKDGFGLATDAELAGFLGITRSALCTVRHKTHRLGPKSKFIVLDKISYLGVRNWVERISGLYIGQRLHMISVTRARLAGKKNIPEDNLIAAEMSLPDEIKQCFKMATDDELATFLGVNRNHISMIRNGKSKLGIDPKLRVLQRIDQIDCAKVQDAISDPDVLIEAVRAHVKKP